MTMGASPYTNPTFLRLASMDLEVARGLSRGQMDIAESAAVDGKRATGGDNAALKDVQIAPVRAAFEGGRVVIGDSLTPGH